MPGGGPGIDLGHAGADRGVAGLGDRPSTGSPASAAGRTRPASRGRQGDRARPRPRWDGWPWPPTATTSSGPPAPTMGRVGRTGQMWRRSRAQRRPRARSRPRRRTRTEVATTLRDAPFEPAQTRPAEPGPGPAYVNPGPLNEIPGPEPVRAGAGLRNASPARRSPPHLAPCEPSATKSTCARSARAHLAQCDLR